MIIAIKEKDRVVLGYTNVDGWSRLAENDYVDEENVAMRFSKNGNIFAFSALDGISDALCYDEEFLNLEITPRGIVREVIPYIKDKMKAMNKSISEKGSWNNALVIADGTHIYDVSPMFDFFEADDYVCHGFHVDTCKVVLCSTVGQPAEERIVKAMKFVRELYKESLFPLVITDTKTKKFKYIYEKGEEV